MSGSIHANLKGVCKRCEGHGLIRVEGNTYVICPDCFRAIANVRCICGQPRDPWYLADCCPHVAPNQYPKSPDQDN